MGDWLIFAGLTLGAVFTYRRAYVIFSEHMRAEFPTLPFTSGDKALSAAFALFAASMWPLVLGGYVVYRTLTPTTPSERLDRLAEREREIARLERELGIR